MRDKDATKLVFHVLLHEEFDYYGGGGFFLYVSSLFLVYNVIVLALVGK